MPHDLEHFYSEGNYMDTIGWILLSASLSLTIHVYVPIYRKKKEIDLEKYYGTQNVRERPTSEL